MKRVEYTSKIYILAKDIYTKVDIVEHLIENLEEGGIDIKYQPAKESRNFKWVVFDQGTISFEKTLKDIKKSEFIDCTKETSNLEKAVKLFKTLAGMRESDDSQLGQWFLSIEEQPIMFSSNPNEKRTAIPIGTIIQCFGTADKDYYRKASQFEVLKYIKTQEK